MTATIRPMLPTDAGAAADVLRSGDFGERLPFFEWALTQPTISAFVAVEGDRIVGTGVGSAQGNAGWVGVIFVVAERRGGGLGRRLTRTVLDELEARRCRTQILIASPLGRPIYEREGFTVLDRQVRFTIDGLPADEARLDPDIRRFAPRDLGGVLALDRAATGEDRGAVLENLLSSESTYVVVDAVGSVRAYLARPPWRGGALIAEEPDDALRLLDIRRHSTGASGTAGAGVLARNEAGRERLRAAGWLEELGGVRMIRGAPLDWEPNWIWGQLNGALG
jgi:GNAT superfamily N-acetyltransferase